MPSNFDLTQTTVEYTNLNISGYPYVVSYSNIDMVPGVPHIDQLEIERLFDTGPKSGGSLFTIADRRRMFKLPKNWYTINETNKTVSILQFSTIANANVTFNLTTGLGLKYYAIDDANTFIVIPNLGANNTIIIRRKTVSEEKIVNFTAGSRLTSGQLNLSSTQLINIIQELLWKIDNEVIIKYDKDAIDGPFLGTTDGAFLDVTGNIDMNLKRITNLGDSATLSDAMPKSEISDVVFRHGVITKDTAPVSTPGVENDVIGGTANEGRSGVWFNPTDGKLRAWAGNQWVIVTNAVNPDVNPTLVKTNTTQTISGAKTFSSPLVVNNTLNVTGNTTLAGALNVTGNITTSGSLSANSVTYTPTGTGAVARSAASKFGDVVSVTDFGAVADGTTDNTAAILAAAVSSGRKLLLIPYNVKYNRSTLLASVTLPDDVVFIDWSGINDFSAAGETTKHFGIVSRDSAPDDTHFAVDSGHHSIINLNNFGTAGSVSAAERKATIAWSSGQFALGASAKQGFRGAALEQFTKSSGSNYWIKGLRSLAPWVAINGNYERWASGEVISATGVYRATGSNHYVSASTGTTGPTAPSHTSGTVSDGGVDWTWVDSADRTVWAIREDGRAGIGATSFASTWRHKVSIVDASGNYGFEGEATGPSKVAVLKLIPTDAASTALPTPFLRADANGLNIMRSDGSTNIVRFTDSEGIVAKELVLVFTSNASTGATPSVDGISVLSVQNTSATTITGFTGGSEGQFIHLYFLNANTTLQTSATFTLTGSVDVTPSAGSVVTMMKVPPGISNRWVEVSRSIK